MRVEVFVTNKNLPRYVGKSYCVRKRKKKNEYRGFDYRGNLI